MSRVLLVGLQISDLKKFQRAFSSVQVPCEALPSIDAALERIPAEPPVLVVAQKPDRLESLHGLQSVLKTNAPATPFLVALSDDSVASALEALKTGAFDCLSRPYDRLQILAASKRAVWRNGRTLFASKVMTPRPVAPPVLALGAALLFCGFVVSKQLDGPPPSSIALGSATLSGIQWDGRALWVGNWMDSTVTEYRSKKGLWTQKRALATQSIFHMQDSQPILVCNTPDALVTVGFDLKMRTHQRAIGLPTLQTVSSPGTNPTGLAWDGEYLWSTDGQTGLIYRHGADLKVLESFRSLVPQPAGLAWDNGKLWVMGGSPPRLASVEIFGQALVWHGPYFVSHLLPEGIQPSGMAVGHGRLWVVSGGDPRMASQPLQDFERQLAGWSTSILKEKR